jgi:ATP-dependent helicase HepA
MSSSPQSFSESQRYSSTSEPELGLGMVTETAKGRVKLHFPLSDATRMYAVDSAPLRRVAFKAGDVIADHLGRSLAVESVAEKDGLFVYAGQGKVISEADLGEMTIQHGAEDRLLTGDVGMPAEFSLRRRTLTFDHARRISPVNGFLGGRIDLIPHQLYIAREVSARHAPRVLLSDEVGLGKTIEACLIVHRLRLLGRVSRVMILVPDSLVHQWFVEMMRRFNMWFHIFDERRCASAEKGAPDGNPFLDDQLILCGSGWLANSPKRAQQAISATWDMLVVDEAHHLQWSAGKPSREYSLVENLGKVSNGLLLLTATPEQLGEESHFARLRLLDPDRYDDFEAFQKETIGHRTMADLVTKLTQAEPLSEPETALLTTLVGIERAAITLTGEQRDQLIRDLLDRHGPGRVVFRNRRSAMQGFPKRIAHLVPINAQTPQIREEKTNSDEVTIGLNHGGANDAIPESPFEVDPRMDWLIGLLRQLRPAKVLLICSTKEKVLALEAELQKHAKLKVGVFHEDLTLVQRDRNAAWFAEAEGARLLLCSEIGSEGRNFQFAHHLVLFDLPLHPDLLEQRIGRLDRIGQSENIHIHVPFLAGTSEEAFARWYHEGLNAFEANLEGGDEMARMFGNRLLDVSESMPSNEATVELSALIAETAAFHAALKTKLAEGRDRLLEMNSFRPEIAEKLIAQIRAADVDPALEGYMAEVFEQFGIDVEDLAPRTYLLNALQGNAIAFPELPDDGLSVTFDRKRALGREDVGFLTWDHPMVTGAIDLVLGSGTGSASFGLLRVGGSPSLLLEVLFVLESSGAQGTDVDRFLPSTPIRIVVDHTGADVTSNYAAEVIDQHVRPGQIDDLLDNESFTESIFPDMLKAATQFAEKEAEIEISKGRIRMESELNHEIDRLMALQQKNNHVRQAEIDLAMAQREELGSKIRDARIRLEALQLIQKGSF